MRPQLTPGSCPSPADHLRRPGGGRVKVEDLDMMTVLPNRCFLPGSDGRVKVEELRGHGMDPTRDMGLRIDAFELCSPRWTLTRSLPSGQAYQLFVVLCCLLSSMGQCDTGHNGLSVIHEPFGSKHLVDGADLKPRCCFESNVCLGNLQALPTL